MLLPHVEIVRLEDAFPVGTFGSMLISSVYFCMTLEPPEFGNKKNVACIPPGQYECEKVVSQKFGTTYEICNIPGRDLVRFHSGFKVMDTRGCVILGRWIDRKNDAIMDSKATFTKFLNTVENPHDKFRLTIKEAWA